MNDVFLGLGTNLGDRIANLRAAIVALEPHVTVHKASTVYESTPQAVGEQPLYLNMVLHASTTLSPQDLLWELKNIEKSMGRAANTHNLPRPIDIDILMYGDQVVAENNLTIPHVAMHERAFVLVPLEEIASFHFHPKLKKPIIDLLDALGSYDETVWRSGEQL